MAIGAAVVLCAVALGACSSSGQHDTVSTESSSSRSSSSRSSSSTDAFTDFTESTNDFTESSTSIPAETTAPATATTVPEVGEEELAECEQQARHAVVTYQPSQQMTAGESSRVVVRASLESSASTTSTSFPGTVPTTSVEARLACTVEARLRGQAFDVDPQGFQRESFLGSDHIDWSWDVTPRSPGTDVLTLEIHGVLHVASGDQQVAQRSFETEITVTSHPEGFLTRVNNAVSGFVEHPVIQFLGFAGLVAIVGFFWQRRRSLGTK